MVTIPKEDEKKTGVQIQVKPINCTEKSLSMTIYGETPSTAYSRIHFLFEQLSKNTKEVVIKHYNKNREVNDESKKPE